MQAMFRNLGGVERSARAWGPAVLGFLLAALGAHPFAGGWNDGSRLAAVEALADRHTFIIDDSIFVRPPRRANSRALPYAAHDAGNLEHGTRDRLWIDGHFYSDKPPLISVLMAGMYRLLQGLGLPLAAERPDLFCWWMTVSTSALAYAVAILALERVGNAVGLAFRTRLLWLASFALGTFALTYTRHVNSHVLFLGLMAVVCWQVVTFVPSLEAGRVDWFRLVMLGCLAGIGFNLDFGCGPLLLAGLFAWLVYRCPCKLRISYFLVGALPWVVAGLGLNYAIGGVWKPLNMVPEYLEWPGSPFSRANLTGIARHGPGQFSLYALSMLFGKKGIFTHNLPLLLTLPAIVQVLGRPGRFRSELLFGVGWCAATWLLYAVLSNNSSGATCSIRWFVPFLAPCYLLLAVYLVEFPGRWPELAALTAWGCILGLLMWRAGPFAFRMPPLLWPLFAAAIVSWAVVRWRWTQTVDHGPSKVSFDPPLQSAA